MKVLKELTREHRHILQGIQHLEMARTALENNLRPPSSFFHTAALFFSEYADRLHHFKEEYLLFSLLAAKKGGKIDLEMGALRHQHELNRKSIKKSSPHSTDMKLTAKSQPPPCWRILPPIYPF